MKERRKYNNNSKPTDGMHRQQHNRLHTGFHHAHAKYKLVRDKYNRKMNDPRSVLNRKWESRTAVVGLIVLALAGVCGVTGYGAYKFQQDRAQRMTRVAHRKPKVVYHTHTKVKYRKPEANPNQANINRKADQEAVDKANRQAFENAQQKADAKIKQENDQFNQKVAHLKTDDQKVMRRADKQANDQKPTQSSRANSANIGSQNSSSSSQNGKEVNQ